MTFHPVGQTIGNIVPPLPVASGGTGSTTLAGWPYDATLADFVASGAVVTGAVGKPADAGHAHPTALFTAADHGMLAWTYDLGVTVSATAPTTNVVNLIRLNIRQSISVTNVLLDVGTGGTTLTSGQNFVGLYAGQTVGAFTAGQLIGTSADQTTPWASTGLKTAALVSGPFTVPAATFVWVAIVSNTTGTTPQFARGAAVSSSFLNAGLAAATARAATNGTATTALAGSITPGSNVLGGTLYWAGLS